MKLKVSLIALTAAITLPLCALAADYKVASVSNGGKITGKVTFSGTDEAPTSYPITKNPEVCGTGSREIDFVKVNNGALNDAVVYLEKVAEGKDWSADVGKALVDQKKCAFSPFLGVMRDGASLPVQNSDPVLHNIHTYEIMGKAKRTVFNVSQPPEVKVINKEVGLKRGVSMKLECDAHDFMHGFTFVAKNPYYAVVKDNGTFSIDGVPPGTYTIKAWHGTLGEQKGSVTVAAGGSATTNFEFKN